MKIIDKIGELLVEIGTHLEYLEKASEMKQHLIKTLEDDNKKLREKLESKDD